MQKAYECESARPEWVEQIPRPGAGIPESRFRASPCDLELERQVKNFRFRIPRQHFLFTLLHIFKISFPPVFLNRYPRAFSDFPTYDRRAKQEAQSQVSTDPFASFGTE